MAKSTRSPRSHRRGQARPHGLARVEDEHRVHPDRAVEPPVRAEAGGSLDELEHFVGRQGLQTRHPELLVGIALVQQPDVPTDVAQVVAHDRTGHHAGDEAIGELPTIVRARRPPVVEHREPRRMGSDNVHPFHRTGSARLARGLDLRGAVVVVTGASSGFGELASLRFARAGSSVVLAARRLERLEALAERISARGGIAVPLRCDVSRPDDLEALRDRVAETFERCDVLVNNAGIPGGGAFEEVELARLERVIEVNLLGVVRATKLFLPMMLERRRGHIVNIASLAGRFATRRGLPCTAPRSTGSSRSARPCTTSSPRKGSSSRA